VAADSWAPTHRCGVDPARRSGRSSVRPPTSTFRDRDGRPFAGAGKRLERAQVRPPALTCVVGQTRGTDLRHRIGEFANRGGVGEGRYVDAGAGRERCRQSIPQGLVLFSARLESCGRIFGAGDAGWGPEGFRTMGACGEAFGGQCGGSRLMRSAGEFGRASGGLGLGRFWFGDVPSRIFSGLVSALLAGVADFPNGRPKRAHRRQFDVPFTAARRGTWFRHHGRDQSGIVSFGFLRLLKQVLGTVFANRDARVSPANASGNSGGKSLIERQASTSSR